MTKVELMLAIAQELIRKSGVSAWSSPQDRKAITDAAIEIANLIWAKAQEK